MTRSYTLSDEVWLKDLINSNAKELLKKDIRRSLSLQSYCIVVLGAGKVGKTSIVKRLLGRRFPENYVPTISEVYEKRIPLSGRQRNRDVALKIYDTCGSQSFPLETALTIDQGDAFVVVYSVDSEKTLTKAERLLEEVQQRQPRQASKPCVLVANKRDVPWDCREVTFDQGLQVAVRHRSSFLEISARESDEIEDIFQSLVRKVKCQAYLQLLKQNDRKDIKDVHHRSKFFRGLTF